MNLEAERKLTTFMELAEKLWIEEFNRPRREQRQVVVVLGCAQKKNSSSSAPSRIASRTFVGNMKKTNCALWIRWKSSNSISYK